MPNSFWRKESVTFYSTYTQRIREKKKIWRHRVNTMNNLVISKSHENGVFIPFAYLHTLINQNPSSMFDFKGCFIILALRWHADIADHLDAGTNITCLVKLVKVPLTSHYAKTSVWLSGWNWDNRKHQMPDEDNGCDGGGILQVLTTSRWSTATDRIQQSETQPKP